MTYPYAFWNFSILIIVVILMQATHTYISVLVLYSFVQITP
jgi:hypothetical protein